MKNCIRLCAALLSTTFVAACFGIYSKDGKEWIVEGHGVDPDIVVDNDPGKEFKGEDQQLDRALQEIQDELKTKRYELPSPPPWPNRNPAG